MKRTITFILLLAITAFSANAGATELPRAYGLVPFQREQLNLTRAIGNSDVLLIADDHTQRAIKTFLTGELKELHGLGFRCLAIEMVPRRFQSALERWNDSDQGIIRDHLIRYWGEKGWGIADSLFNLIASAKREGLMVIALDPETTLLTDRNSVNSSWVECIQQCLIGKGGGRMIVFGGAGHFQARADSAYSLLKAQGLRLSVLEFSGLDSAESLDLNLKTAELLNRPVPFRLQVARESRRMGFAGPFMVRDDSDGMQTLSRWVIELEPESPQLALKPTNQ